MRTGVDHGRVYGFMHGHVHDEAQRDVCVDVCMDMRVNGFLRVLGGAAWGLQRACRRTAI